MIQTFSYLGHTVTLRFGKVYDEAYLDKEPFYSCKAGLREDFAEHVKSMIDWEDSLKDRDINI